MTTIRTEGVAVQEQTVAIGIKDLVTLMASEVARKVADELRDSDINPLHKRVRAIELQIAKPDKETGDNTEAIAHWRGVFDGLWKAGVIAIAILQIYHMWIQK